MQSYVDSRKGHFLERELFRANTLAVEAHERGILKQNRKHGVPGRNMEEMLLLRHILWKPRAPIIYPPLPDIRVKKHLRERKL